MFVWMKHKVRKFRLWLSVLVRPRKLTRQEMIDETIYIMSRDKRFKEIVTKTLSKPFVDLSNEYALTPEDQAFFDAIGISAEGRKRYAENRTKSSEFEKKISNGTVSVDLSDYFVPGDDKDVH